MTSMSTMSVCTLLKTHFETFYNETQQLVCAKSWFNTLLVVFLSCTTWDLKMLPCKLCFASFIALALPLSSKLWVTLIFRKSQYPGLWFTQELSTYTRGMSVASYCWLQGEIIIFSIAVPVVVPGKQVSFRLHISSRNETLEKMCYFVVVNPFFFTGKYDSYRNTHVCFTLSALMSLKLHVLLNFFYLLYAAYQL